MRGRRKARLSRGLSRLLFIKSRPAFTFLRKFEQWSDILRKEVIQPQVPLRLPCYDLTPVADPTVAKCPLSVSTLSSGKANSHGLTGGVYKARERIHRGTLIRDY